jgi:sucrose-phosphate synthase
MCPTFELIATPLSGGVFVNPALTEPFGLTLLEAAAMVRRSPLTEDGSRVISSATVTMASPSTRSIVIRLWRHSLNLLKIPKSGSGWLTNGLRNVKKYSLLAGLR